MSQKSAAPPPAEWIHQLMAMKRIRSCSQLIKKHGSPHHKARSGEMETWHYPLGVAGGMLYSIHVIVSGDKAPQTFMHMEPTNAPDTPRSPRRAPPWWRFW